MRWIPFFWNWPRYCAWNRRRVLGSEVRGSVFLQSATLCSLMSSAVHCAGKLEYYFSSIQPSIWCQIRTCPTKEFHSLFYDLWTICEIWYIYHEGYPRPTKIPTGGVVDFQKIFNWFNSIESTHLSFNFHLPSQLLKLSLIPDVCHFFYTGRILGSKILHTKNN